MKVSIDPETNLEEKRPNPYALITGTKVQADYGDNSYITDSPVSYNYDSMNFTGKYKDKISDYRKYGVPTSRYFNWDQERAKNQGIGEKWVNGLAKAGVTTLGAVAENTLGIAFGLGELVKGGAYYDNYIGRSIDKMNENMREAFPNYRTQEEQELSTGKKLLTANFWADTVANGFGYSLGSLATIYLTGGVGLVGRAAKSMQIYNTAKALSTGTKIANTVGKGSRFTRQGFINSVNMFEMGLYMSLAESSVEARENQKRTYEALIAKELELQGLANKSQLSAIDLKAIEDASYASGNRHFITQLPVLMGTNLFMFGKQVAGFKASTKVNKDVAFDAALNKTVSTIANQGKFKNALSRLRPFVEGAATEAFQEGWQFASGVISSDYHTDKYFNGGVANLTESIYKGITETLGTQEGLESMLVGAIVGGGMSGVSSAVSKPFKQRKAAADYAAELINGGFMDNANNKMLDYNAQAKVVQEMEKALKEVMPDGTVGNIKRFKDAQFKLIQYNAFAALESGTYDVFREKLKDSKSLSDVEFAKAFGFNTEMTIEEQAGGKSKTDVIKNIEDKLDKFKKVYTNVNQMFPSIPKSQGLDRLRMSEAEQKAEDAVHDKRANLRAELILSASGIENRNERLESIQKQMKDVIERGSKLNGVKIDSDIDLILNPGEDLLEVEDGKYDAETEVNIIGKGLQDIKQKLLNKGVTAEVLTFDKLARDYIELFMDNSTSIDRYNKLASNKYFQDLFENTVKENQAEAEQVAKNEKVNEDIENATTAEEARKAAPEDASEEAQANARKKANALEKEEKESELKYLKLHKDKSPKEQLKSLQYIAANEDLSPTEKAGLATAIKLLENKVKKNSTESVTTKEEVENLAITDDNILRAENNQKIENNKPEERYVKPASTTTSDTRKSDPVATSTGELNIVSATNTDEVVNVGTPNDPIYKIPVDSQGNPIEKDGDTLDSKPILLQPELLLKEDILEEEIEFEIIENDWYKSDRLDKAEESWTEIPIYYKIGNAYIGKLEASNNEDRKAIVDKLLRGDKVTTQISQILATNFNNSIDSETNEFYFHNPQEVFGKEDDILIAISEPEIAGDPKTGQWSLNVVHPDKNKNDELDNINTEITREVTDKFNHQIGIVIKKENNPQGKARISIAMTSNLNSLANEMVIKYLSEKNYEAARMIVANSKNRKSANTNNSYLEFGAFESGQKYIVYKSPKLGKLIRINEDEFVKAINDNEAVFQIVTEKDEKFTGRKPNTTESKIDIVEDLSNFLSTKKYQVDKALMNSKVHTKENPYISPVTGIAHDTYQDYLFDSKELGDEPRIQDAGYNSILSTDIVKKRESMFNSPRITFKKGNILGETAPEIIKNTKIAETSPEAPVAKKTQYASKLKEIFDKRKLATKADLKNSQLIKDIRVDKTQSKTIKPNKADKNLASIMLYGKTYNELIEQGLPEEALEAETLAYRILNDLLVNINDSLFYKEIVQIDPSIATTLTTNENPVKEYFESDIFEQAEKQLKKQKFKTGKKSGNIVNNLSKKCKGK